jgi:hypothetical protein
MKRFRRSVFPLVIASALVLCAGAEAAMVGIYRNTLDTLPQRTEVLKVMGRSCTRAGAAGALEVSVGKRTEECAYRSPVLGRNLEVAAAGRLLATTPKAVARRAFLGLALRAGGGSRYELRVFPGQKKVQLLKFAGAGEIEYLAIEKRVAAVNGPGAANVLRLRAEGDGPRTKLIAHLGSEVVAEALDEGTRIEGELSAVLAGAPDDGRGVAAEFGGIAVRVPVRF